MVNVSETVQTMFEVWFNKVTKLVFLEKTPDENKALRLFLKRMSPEDATKVLEYDPYTPEPKNE